MKLGNSSIAVHPPGSGALSGASPAAREFQELWFALARRPWMSLVVVPTDPGGSAAPVVTALADVGLRVSEMPVTAITAASLEYGSARALADIERHVADDRRPGTIVDVTTRESKAWSAGNAAPDATTAEPTHALAPAGRVILALPSVISEPLGLAVAHAADAVVLSIELGRSRLRDVRRTIELVGRDRIAGCFLARASDGARRPSATSAATRPGR